MAGSPRRTRTTSRSARPARTTTPRDRLPSVRIVVPGWTSSPGSALRRRMTPAAGATITAYRRLNAAVSSSAPATSRPVCAFWSCSSVATLSAYSRWALPRSRSAFAAALRARVTAASISLKSSTASVSPARTVRPSSTTTRPITPPTLKLSVTSSFWPSVPVAVTGRARAAIVTGAMRTVTGAAAGGVGASAPLRPQWASVSASSRGRGIRFMAAVPFFLEGEGAERGRAFQVDPSHRVAVRPEHTGQLGARVRGARVHELEGAGDAFVVAPPHQRERAPRRFQPGVGRGDRRLGDGGRLVRRAHFEPDPVRQIPLQRADALDLVPSRSAPGGVAAAIEEIPRDDQRGGPVIVLTAEREVAALEPVVHRHGDAREERRGGNAARRHGGTLAGRRLPPLLTHPQRLRHCAVRGDVQREGERAARNHGDRRVEGPPQDAVERTRCRQIPLPRLAELFVPIGPLGPA